MGQREYFFLFLSFFFGSHAGTTRRKWQLTTFVARTPDTLSLFLFFRCFMSDPWITISENKVWNLKAYANYWYCIHKICVPVKGFLPAKYICFCLICCSRQCSLNHWPDQIEKKILQTKDAKERTGRGKYNDAFVLGQVLSARWHTSQV